MEPYKENIITISDPFPVEVFIQDNEKSSIIVESHWHDCIEVLCVLEGTAKQQVNEHIFHVNAHDVIIINKGDIHGTWCKKEDVCKILVLKFLPELIQYSTNIYDSKYIYSFLRDHKKHLFYLQNLALEDSFIYELFMGVLKEFESKDTAFEMIIKGYIYQIIAILIRSGNLNLYDKLLDENDLKMISPIIEYIEKHYDESITLEKAAKMVNMSYYHFSRYFKKVTGRNFKEYVDYVRVNEAEKRLYIDGMKITQAAYEVGYNNVSSFDRVYKRIRGCSPSKMIRAKNEKD